MNSVVRMLSLAGRGVRVRRTGLGFLVMAKKLVSIDDDMAVLGDPENDGYLTNVNTQ